MEYEYFASLHYIWLNIVFFIFSLFLFGVCLYACLFVRWVYKRRLRQKTDAMIECYKTGEDKRKEMELNLKRQELNPLPETKKTAPKQPRKIHIVTKPCDEVVPKKANELLVRQVNERASDEVRCSPIMPNPPPQFMGAQVQQLQTQYVMVPMEVLRNQFKSNRQQFPPIMSYACPRQDPKMFVETVGTQTSDTVTSVSGLEKKKSEDWVPGYDERDAEREEDRSDIDLTEDDDDGDSDRIMKRRMHQYNKQKKVPNEQMSVLSEETRVSLESGFSPTKPSAPPTSSGSTSAATKSTTASSTSTDRSSEDKKPLSTKTTGTHSSSNSADDKSNSLKKEPSVSRTSYFTSPGESTAALSSNKSQPPVKQPSLLSRAAIFPYFVDSKAPGTEASTEKSVSKLTEPRVEDDSSFDLYRDTVKSKVSKSEKYYTRTPKTNNK